MLFSSQLRYLLELQAPPRWVPRVANVTPQLRNIEVFDGVLKASNPPHEALHAADSWSGFEARSATHVLLCVRRGAAAAIGRKLKSLWLVIGRGLEVQTAESKKSPS